MLKHKKGCNKHFKAWHRVPFQGCRCGKCELFSLGDGICLDEVFRARVREWLKLVIDCLRETPPGKGFPLPKTHVPKLVEIIEIGKSLIANTKISWVGETDSQCKKCLRMIWLQKALCCVLARRHSAEILPCDCNPRATTHVNPTYLAICGYLPWSYLPNTEKLVEGQLWFIIDNWWYPLLNCHNSEGYFLGRFGRISMKDETGKLFFPLLLFPSGGTRSQKRHISVCLGVEGVFSCFFHGHVPHSWWPPP